MKQFILGLIMAIFAFQAYANIQNAPKNFNHNNQNIIFVDIQSIESKIKYDINQRKAYASSYIVFEQFQTGYPIIDLVPNSKNIVINGQTANMREINSPHNETKYKVISKVLQPGIHKLYLENAIDKNISFTRSEVKSAFWTTDLSDRSFIEQYLPSNLEYDQYKLTLNIDVHGKNISEHEIFHNGKTLSSQKNSFKVEFPSYYNASSFYFHITKKNRFPRIQFHYTSINGKEIPVTIYSRSSWSLSSAKKETLRVLKELENKLGAWSHPSFTAYIAGSGGMEYAGATITSMSALGHEITHSFFARSVMPMNGNSGWIDEAIASWRDGGYKTTSSPNFSSTSMAAHSEYRRKTDRKAYREGANFMAYLNQELVNQGGLIKFLELIYQNYKHTTIDTEIFKKELEQYTGTNFDHDFSKYIYGKKNKNTISLDENPYHPKLTEKQLLELL